ncbi:MAG: hypothetical protein CM1200mP1_12650 [Candidatus Neomarinimicrobiota bacterium]|nr:MAG: hypothetical protein CM1200mP1_12650 [Candidatus Neomarinimicrobiota bacterium]
MNNCCDTIGDYLGHERYFQAFVSKGDDVYIADLYLQAALFEHQDQGEVGAINNHPFLKGLELFDEEKRAHIYKWSLNQEAKENNFIINLKNTVKINLFFYFN